MVALPVFHTIVPPAGATAAVTIAVASTPAQIVIGAQVGAAGVLVLVIVLVQFALPQLFVTVYV